MRFKFKVHGSGPRGETLRVMNVSDQMCIEITMHTGNFWLRVGVGGGGLATLASGSRMQVLFLGPQVKDLWSGFLCFQIVSVALLWI